jgi:hypothetical protein
MENQNEIPRNIQVEIYYYIDDNGQIQFDIEEMTAEFENKLNQLETLNTK